MTRAALVAAAAVMLVTAAACGAYRKPPEPLHDEPVLERTKRAVEDPPEGWLADPAPAPTVPRRSDVNVFETSARRPVVDLSLLLPDPTHELRWPLTPSLHPALEPQYEIARALAQPGVSWLDLCQRGAHNRRVPGQADLLQYLRAWCSVAKHDNDAAASQLASLTRSTVLGLRSAVRIDLANVLVDHGNADQAEHLLTRHAVRDVPVLDTLAAVYVELGKLGDADQINTRALDNDDGSNDADRCRRLARRIVLRAGSADMGVVPGAKLPSLVNLETLAGGNDPTCVRLAHELGCWILPGSKCEPYLRDQGLDPARGVNLLAVYHGWPAAPVYGGEWIRIALLALGAMPLPGADLLAVTALEASLRTTTCDSFRIKEIVGAALQIKWAPGHSAALDHRLDMLTTVPLTGCL